MRGRARIQFLPLSLYSAVAFESQPVSFSLCAESTLMKGNHTNTAAWEKVEIEPKNAEDIVRNDTECLPN